MSYHVLRQDREITDSNVFQSILENGKYGVVGLSKNDEPYVVTLSYGYDKVENTLYFHCAKKGQKIDFIKANPRACVTIIEDNGFDDETCEHSYKSLIVRGKIELVQDREEIDRGIRLMIHQLEKRDIDKLLSKLTTTDKHYLRLQMLKMKIESITGKARQKKPSPGAWS